MRRSQNEQTSDRQPGSSSVPAHAAGHPFGRRRILAAARHGAGLQVGLSSAGRGLRPLRPFYGELIARRSVRSDPDAARALEIEQKDERNIAISNAAKAKAFDVMLAAFSPLILILALLEVDLLPLLLTVGVYLFVVFDSIYWLNRYHKEM